MIKEYKLLPFMTAEKNCTTDLRKILSNYLKKGRSSERTIGEVI